MEARWEKVQLGLHLLLFSSTLYVALLVGYLWTAGGALLGIKGLAEMGTLAAALLQLLARLLLLAAPGAGWGVVALGLDLLGYALPFLGHGSRLYRAAAVVPHFVAGLATLGQLRALARHLERPDLVLWVKRLGILLLATAGGLVFARWLGKPSLFLAAVAFGLAFVRYLRLVSALGVEVSKDLRLWRNMD